MRAAALTEHVAHGQPSLATANDECTDALDRHDCLRWECGFTFTIGYSFLSRARAPSSREHVSPGTGLMRVEDAATVSVHSRTSSGLRADISDRLLSPQTCT